MSLRLLSKAVSACPVDSARNPASAAPISDMLPQMHSTEDGLFASESE